MHAHLSDQILCIQMLRYTVCTNKLDRRMCHLYAISDPCVCNDGFLYSSYAVAPVMSIVSVGILIAITILAATIKWAWSSAILTFKMRALLHIKSSASSTNSQPTTRGRTRWEVSCVHPAAVASKKVLSAVDSGISRRVERQTTEQRADGHGCWVKGKSNVRSRRRGAGPSKGIIIRCLEVFWI